jgi:hypothetical protein
VPELWLLKHIPSRLTVKYQARAVGLIGGITLDVLMG